MVELKAHEGAFVEGSVVPAIKDLLVQLTNKGTVISTTSTDVNGQYRYKIFLINRHLKSPY